MPLSRASTRTSLYSQSSQTFSDQDIPGGYPDTEAARAVSTQQTLSEAIHARRAEFTRPHSIRIKVGSWNVAGKKGTESDIGAWFVKSKGVSQALSGLENTHLSEPHSGHDTDLPTESRREGVDEQEARVSNEPKKAPTQPKHDPGELPKYRDIGLYVLGLQEIVDISSATEALRPFSDPWVGNRWKTKIEEALPSGYQLVAQQQLTGLMMFIYASPTVAPQITSVSSTSCGTGLGGFMGNKGAVTTRIVLGETTRLAFVNSHLSSGLGKAELDRRNWDAAQIIGRTQYDPIQDSLGYVSPRKEHLGEEDFSFWFGDLNYRLEGIPGDDVRRILMFYTRDEYDLSQERARRVDREIAESTTSIKHRHSKEASNASSSSSSSSSSSAPSGTNDDRSEAGQASDDVTDLDDGDDLDPGSDPTHLQTTLNSLLPHDELHQMQHQRRAFHDGWREGPITFLPTYKYDVGSVGVFDSGDKKRGPSWCDRILYRTRKDKTDYENKLLEEQEAQRKDKEFAANKMDEAASEESTLYDYDPEADAEADNQDDLEFTTGDEAITSTTEEGYQDIIQLEYYVSHQRILSSDHKPLDAVFRLEYDAVIPELKSKIHQEVARDLDRAENEARPSVTLIPDSHSDSNGKDIQALYFGDVRYDEVKTQTLTLANTGRATATFGFVSQQHEDTKEMSPTPTWLEVAVEAPEGAEPERGAMKQAKTKTEGDWATDVSEVYSLEPGCTCTIRCRLTVNSTNLVKRLNNGGVLDSIIILRVKEGRDHFVPIRGAWMPTVLTRSVDELTRLPDTGVRTSVEQSESHSQDGGKRDSAVMSSAPKELFRLTQAIETLSERLLAEWSMLQDVSEEQQQAPWVTHAGWPFEGWTLNVDERHSLRGSVLEALDTTQNFAEVLPVDEPPLHRLEAMCDALLLVLETIHDGIITEDLWTKLVQGYFNNARSKLAISRDDQRAAILEILATSSPHSISFILLTSMLGSLSQEVSSNALDSKAQPLPASPKVHIRRKTLSAHPEVARKQLVQKNYAAIFADVLVKWPDDVTAKAWNASQEHRRQLVEIFLDHGSDPG